MYVGLAARSLDVQLGGTRQHDPVDSRAAAVAGEMSCGSGAADIPFALREALAAERPAIIHMAIDAGSGLCGGS